MIKIITTLKSTMASFSEEIDPWLAIYPLKTNGRLANLEFPE